MSSQKISRKRYVTVRLTEDQAEGLLAAAEKGIRFLLNSREPDDGTLADGADQAPSS